MADELITLRELALWTQNDVDVVTADPFAIEVIDKVSQMARFLGGQPTWTYGGPAETDAPFDVRMVVLKICKRTYENPGQVVQEGNVGPIGGDRVLDVAAMLLDLTDAERATFTKYNDEGDPDDAGAELWVQPTTRGGPDLTEPVVLYWADDQQINMTPDQSAYPSWDIPMFSPGDPGDPNLYTDD
jgi:hypothetical protein